MTAACPHLRAVLATAVLAAATAVAVGEAQASSPHSVGSPEQIAWVRHAADRFLGAELTKNAGEACAVLNAPMRATVHGSSCEKRWKTRLAKLLREPGERTRLRTERRAVASGRVVVRGHTASIDLPEPLLQGPNRFRFTENCWMLER
ncbi:MAG TPA: hypothetical protein VMB91_09685 [Solirubrobacteraceae bacterium]|nr:hypothetical protein [Solirubrobacteraceae bacterium]